MFSNAERILGLKRAFPVLVGDILKGLIPILLARNFFSSTLVLSVVGGCALVGHVFPVWLRFKGGKAIATSIGVATGLSGIFGLVALLTYITTRLFIKDAALRSLLTIASLVVAGFMMRSAFIPFLCTDFVFVLWTHRMNIRSLWYSRRRLK